MILRDLEPLLYFKEAAGIARSCDDYVNLLYALEYLSRTMLQFGIKDPYKVADPSIKLMKEFGVSFDSLNSAMIKVGDEAIKDGLTLIDALALLAVASSCGLDTVREPGSYRAMGFCVSEAMVKRFRSPNYPLTSSAQITYDCLFEKEGSELERIKDLLASSRGMTLEAARIKGAV